MDSVKAELLCERCELFLASASAVLSIDAHREVLLRAVRQDLAEELSEFSSMLCFFECIALVSLCDFRIAFTISLAAHSEVHADFGALAREVLAKAFEDARINVLGNADAMLICERHLTALLNELGCRSMADRALSRSCFAFVNITANRANKLFHNDSLLKYILIFIHIVGGYRLSALGRSPVLLTCYALIIRHMTANRNIYMERLKKIISQMLILSTCIAVYHILLNKLVTDNNY